MRLGPINAILKMQMMVLLALGLFYWGWQDAAAAIACVYGGGIALVGTGLQRWYLIRAVKSAGSDAGKNLGKVYRCMIDRWLITIVLFAVAFIKLPLLPHPLLIGFCITQLAVLFSFFSRA